MGKDVVAIEAQENLSISKLIYSIRGKQVMIDSDLAMLYQVETKKFNQAVKRNIDRFPNNFRFQISKDEYEALRSQIVTLNENVGRGTHRKYLPYAFTEQGIAMLSAVLRSDTAIQVSINIMNAFVEMRHFISNNVLLFERISNIELKQLEYQKNTNDKFDKVFQYIEDHAETRQKIFFDGQIYDAFSFLIGIVKKANNSIVLIDNYVDVSTLNVLAKKNEDVDVKIYTNHRTRLTIEDVANFNSQYPTLSVYYTEAFHDMFFIIDKKIAYHIGASIKDAGKKCFGISRIEDLEIVLDLLRRLENQTEKMIN